MRNGVAGTRPRASSGVDFGERVDAVGEVQRSRAPRRLGRPRNRAVEVPVDLHGRVVPHEPARRRRPPSARGARRRPDRGTATARRRRRAPRASPRISSPRGPHRDRARGRGSRCGRPARRTRPRRRAHASRATSAAVSWPEPPSGTGQPTSWPSAAQHPREESAQHRFGREVGVQRASPASSRRAASEPNSSSPIRRTDSSANRATRVQPSDHALTARRALAVIGGVGVNSAASSGSRRRCPTVVAAAATRRRRRDGTRRATPRSRRDRSTAPGTCRRTAGARARAARGTNAGRTPRGRRPVIAGDANANG